MAEALEDRQLKRGDEIVYHWQWTLVISDWMEVKEWFVFCSGDGHEGGWNHIGAGGNFSGNWINYNVVG